MTTEKMAQVHKIDPPSTSLCPQIINKDQDSDAVNLYLLMRDGLQNTMRRSEALATNATSSNASSTSHDHKAHQEALQGPNTSRPANNTEDCTIGVGTTNLAVNFGKNASHLPQIQTPHPIGALIANSASKDDPGSSNNSPGLYSSFSSNLNAVPSAVNAIAHAVAQEAPLLTPSKKQFHGIASGLSSSIPSQLGISTPNLARANQASNSIPASEYGISRGLGVVGRIGTAVLAAAEKRKGNPSATPGAPGDRGLGSSFTEAHPIAVDDMAGGDDDARSQGYTPPAGGHNPESPPRSPYLQAHSRSLRPNPGRRASPNALPPPSPPPSPVPSPQALSALEGNLSPGLFPSGAESNEAEEDGPQPSPTPQSRGRVRGAPAKAHPAALTPLTSTGRSQPALYSKGAPMEYVRTFRGLDAVESCYPRHMETIVGESQTNRRSPTSQLFHGPTTEEQHSPSVPANTFIMDPFEHLPEALDLSGQVEILDFRPAFNGSCSSVYRGKLQNTGHLVAIKVINTSKGTALHTIQRRLKRERKTWGALNHPNILPLWGVADDQRLFGCFGALISPWRERGDASDFLTGKGDSISLDDRIGLWKDVLEGVKYLHSHEPLLVHGDLKPKNILIDDSGHAQICDFGLVRVLLRAGHSGMTTTTHYTGTERYLAYELVVAGEAAIPTTASDIYPVGCIGLEFIFLQIPYATRYSNAGGQIFSDIKAGQPPAKRLAIISLTSEYIWSWLEACWSIDPVRRPSVETLLTWLGNPIAPSTDVPLTPVSGTELDLRNNAALETHARRAWTR